MSAHDGLPDDMHRPFAARRDQLILDEGTATRLLAGTVDPADAPPGYRRVVAVLAAARAVPRPGELAAAGAAVRAFRAAASGPPAARRRIRPLLALVGAALVAFGGVAAAASTGSLPDPAQSVAHDTLRAVGVSVPAPAPAARRRPVVGPSAVTRAPARRVPDAARLPNPSPVPPSSPRAPPRGGPNRDTRAATLCRAYGGGRIGPRGGRQPEQALRELAGLAGGVDKIPGYCQGVLG